MDKTLREAIDALLLAAAAVLDCDEAGDAEAQSDEWSEATMALATAMDGLRSELETSADAVPQTR